MAQIPAVCESCETMFGSGIPLIPGIETRQVLTTCPNCQRSTWVMDGYGTIINGLVAFITTSKFTYEEKSQFLKSAKTVLKSGVDAAEAERILKPINEDGWKLFCEWSVWGMMLVTVMIGLAGLMLEYQKSGRNEPLEEVAAQTVDQILSGEISLDGVEQIQQPETAPAPTPPTAGPSVAEPKAEGLKGTDPETKAPDEDG